MLEMKEEGRTVIFSTHRMEQVEMICDNICLINKAEKVLEGNLTEIKKRYGRNTVFLEYEGESHFVRNLPQIDKIDDYGKYMEIRLKEGTDPEGLLEEIVGKTRINKFEVKEPSLNAIFIELVGEGNEKDHIRH